MKKTEWPMRCMQSCSSCESFVMTQHQCGDWLYGCDKSHVYLGLYQIIKFEALIVPPACLQLGCIVIEDEE